MTPKKDSVYTGDCIDIMRQMPDSCVDIIFADPPYFMQLRKELHRPDSTRVRAVDDDWDKFSDFNAYDEFTHEWLTQARRILKDTGTLWVIGSYHNIFRVGTQLQDLGFWILNDIIWRKTNPMPNFKGTRFSNAHETLIWCTKEPRTKYTFNYESMKAFNEDLQMRSDWTLPICNGPERIKDENGKKIHTTQKPASLLYRVILASSNPGDTILDPFFGTGTTGVVAKTLGRHYIGIEQDSAYVTVAKKRLEQTTTLDKDLLNPVPKTLPNQIPFGLMVEAGIIPPGTHLCNKKGQFDCVVCADGSLMWKKHRGSIHQISALVQNATACNGWTYWYMYDAKTKKRILIDILRQDVTIISSIQKGKKT